MNGSKARTIKDLPTLSRPREKALHYGINTLTEIELLAIIIGEGTNGRNALEIAEILHKEHVSLINMYRLTNVNSLKVHGIGKAKALRLLAVFELNKRLLYMEAKKDTFMYKEDEIIATYQQRIGHLTKETLYLITLNRRNMIISEKQLYLGSELGFSIDAKEIIRELLLANADQYVLIHNHPSGDVAPSDHDLETTYKLAEMSAKFGVYLFDHLIISAADFFSLRHTAKLQRKG